MRHAIRPVAIIAFPRKGKRISGSAAEYISLRLGRNSGARAKASFTYCFIFARFPYLDALMYI